MMKIVYEFSACNNTEWQKVNWKMSQCEVVLWILHLYLYLCSSSIHMERCFLTMSDEATFLYLWIFRSFSPWVCVHLINIHLTLLVVPKILIIMIKWILWPYINMYVVYIYCIDYMNIILSTGEEVNYILDIVPAIYMIMECRSESSIAFSQLIPPLAYYARENRWKLALRSSPTYRWSKTSECMHCWLTQRTKNAVEEMLTTEECIGRIRIIFYIFICHLLFRFLCLGGAFFLSPWHNGQMNAWIDTRIICWNSPIWHKFKYISLASRSTCSDLPMNGSEWTDT